MGAYITNEWPTSEMWKLAVRKRQELILSPQYLQAMHDECIMAVIFGYIPPLLEKILSFSLPSEHEDVLSLFSDKVDIMINNGNIVISN
jgi:hypothetical protein